MDRSHLDAPPAAAAADSAPLTDAHDDEGPGGPGVDWRPLVADFQQSSTRRAVWQIISTFVPYVLLWCLMYYTAPLSWWITAPLAVLSGALLVRVFIIFHDCGHGSYLRSRRANDTLGFITGLLTVTPYYHWRWEHAIHHVSAGHLDKRGTGDIWTMTVQEYLESSRWQRFAYRLARNPFVLFVLAPLFVFLVRERFPSAKAPPRERRSVWWTNLGIVVISVVLCRVFGCVDYLMIKVVEVTTAGAAGIWLFYMQHQFEDVYWERGAEWNYTSAALRGSSFYKLPVVLQWFSGNIGFHHIHHLSARIPNYHLQRCHNADPLFQQVRPMTLLSSLSALSLRLWDEKGGKLVGYKRLRQLRRESLGRSVSL